MNNLKEELQLLIDKANNLGLKEIDKNIAQEYLDNREYGLTFDTIVEQLYEYNILIDLETFNLIKNIILKMKLSESNYSFIKELYN